MDCSKCGAEIPAGADECAACGEPVAAPAPEPVAVTDDTTPAARPAARTGGASKTILTILVGLLVVAALGGVGYYIFSRVTAGNSPEAAAMAMLKAYAAYDAQAILDTATHKSLPPDGVKEFEKQAKEAKERAGGKPGVKDYKVTKVTKESEDQAVVEITAQWLTDPSKGTYTKRTEKLTVVKQDGKWLVKLF